MMNIEVLIPVSLTRAFNSAMAKVNVRLICNDLKSDRLIGITVAVPANDSSWGHYVRGVADGLCHAMTD